jgi:2-C-methyl-D-erythritol 4-phosphate cytidylyltransferase/2-C-methyl-D-erythritol 2,4-cyclodiphosphate synthase
MTYAKELLIKENFKINNIDVTVICEKPKIGQYKSSMLKSIGKALNLKVEHINIKATTTEKLGFLGREEGIACQASVTISKINDS